MLSHAPLAATLLLAALPSALAGECQCLNGWTMVGGLCTKHYAEADSASSFAKASATCAMNDAVLAIPRSEYNKQELMNASNNEDIWVGLTRFRARRNSFKDTFGRKPAYIDWNDGEPNNNNHVLRRKVPYSWNEENCVHIYGNGFHKYNDISCSKKQFGFICVACPPNYSRVNSACEGCPDGWTPYRDQCLKLYKDTQTFETSISKCSEKGAALFTPKNERDNTMLRNFAGGYNVWIGYTDAANEGIWMTADAENPKNMKYSKWGPEEPNNDLGNEHCVEQTPGGEWNDRRCFEHEARVCVRDQKTMLDLY